MWFFGVQYLLRFFPLSRQTDILALRLFGSRNLLQHCFPMKHWFNEICGVIILNVLLLTTTCTKKCVMEWSGRCCRHSSLHSGKSETTAGSIQQQQEFILQTKPAQNQHKSNRHTQPNIHSECRLQRKQTVQSNRSSKQPNQQNLCFLGPLQL